LPAVVGVGRDPVASDHLGGRRRRRRFLEDRDDLLFRVTPTRPGHGSSVPEGYRRMLTHAASASGEQVMGLRKATGMEVGGQLPSATLFESLSGPVEPEGRDGAIYVRQVGGQFGEESPQLRHWRLGGERP